MAWFRRAHTNPTGQQLVESPGTPRDFRLTVQDVFTITGRGTLVTGPVESGVAATGDTVRLTRTNGTAGDVVITAIEAFRMELDVASAGQRVGLFLRDVDRDAVGRGDVVTG